MQVGDLVKHSGLNDITWYGIVTIAIPRSSGIVRYWVEWTFGDRGWFYCSDLEAVCK